MNFQISNERRQLIRLLAEANEFRRNKQFRQAILVYLAIVEKSNLIAIEQIASMISHCYFYLGLHETQNTDENFQEAVFWAEQAIANRADNSSLYANLGEIHLLGTLDYEKAEEALRKSIELDPRNVQALLGGAALFEIPGSKVSLDEAILWLKVANEMKPSNHNNHFRLGNLLFQAGNFDEALKEWETSLLSVQPLDKSPMENILNKIRV